MMPVARCSPLHKKAPGLTLTLTLTGQCYFPLVVLVQEKMAS